VEDGFTHYWLRIDGLVEKPAQLSYAEMKAMPKQNKSPPISAFRDGQALPGGAAFRCSSPRSGEAVKLAADAR